MGEPIRICIVGAGSSYTPELIDGILRESDGELPVSVIKMTDINSERLEVMAGLAERMIRAKGRGIAVQRDTDLARMLEEVECVITQIRVGGMTARDLDETIPLKYGVIGQETTGPGGMLKALRTIPAMIEVGRTVARVAPDAFILNYTNPSGIIAEAVSKHTGARIIGLCSGMPGLQQFLAERLRETYGEARSYCVGLNHLGFVHRILAGDRDITAEAIEGLLEGADPEDESFREWMKLAGDLGAIPLRGYSSYYYHRDRMVRKQREAGENRAKQIMEIERELFAEASDLATVEKPPALSRRGGGGYSAVTLAVMKAIHHRRPDKIAASVPNNGSVDGFADDATVEVVCRVEENGATPLRVGPVPLPFRGLVQAVKAYESLTVDAAVARSRRVALRALLTHPLVGDTEIAEPLLDEMLAAHGLHFE